MPTLPSSLFATQYLLQTPQYVAHNSSYFRRTSNFPSITLETQRPVVTATCSPVSAPAPATAVEPPCLPSRLDSIPPEKLKSLRKIGLEMKDVIKLGRLGVGKGIIQQIRNRWQTSEVAKLYCGGKAGVNMKLMAEALEKETGGIVIHRSGGSVYLYRDIEGMVDRLARLTKADRCCSSDSGEDDLMT